MTPARLIAPPDFLAAPELRAVLAALPRARVVGGAVRDALAAPGGVCLLTADIDLATPDPPAAIAAALAAAGLRAIPTGLAHGTLTALSGGRSFEITTLRRDVATDGRHAQVAWTDSWREDAARRDFTINAMSMTADGAVYDYFGGLADLAAGLVRFVGDPATRIAEDRLRALRFFRFQARFGHGPPDPAALAAIAAAAADLPSLSAERIWSELSRILAVPDPVPVITLMDHLGVLAPLLPPPLRPAALADLCARGAPADALLRLAALSGAAAESLARRLRLSAAERARLQAWRTAPLASPDMDAAARRRLRAQWSADALVGRLWLEGGAGKDWAGEDWAALRTDLASLPAPIFPLAGRDALAAGIAPGPAMGVALRAVREWWLEGGCVADAAACRAKLQS